MKNYDIILFDLDGTLTDPGLGITNSAAYALHKFQIEVPDRTSLYKFIGPPLIESFEKYYGFSAEEAQTALHYFREYFSVTGILENEVYPGIKELLQALQSAGKSILLATSKPEEYARRILAHFDLDSYFTYIAGATMDEKRVKKAEVIQYALDFCNITDTSRAVMIGDREHDILGAKAHGLDSIGVLFGYGNREELEAAGATLLAETVADLEHYLLID